MTLAKNIKKDLKSHEETVVINCASLEYFKAIDYSLLDADVVTSSI